MQPHAHSRRPTRHPQLRLALALSLALLSLVFLASPQQQVSALRERPKAAPSNPAQGSVPVALIVAGTTFTVNSTDDTADASPGDGVCETATGNGVCTLRAAIQEANASTGPVTISFNIPASDVHHY